MRKHDKVAPQGYTTFMPSEVKRLLEMSRKLVERSKQLEEETKKLRAQADKLINPAAKATSKEK